MKTLDYGDIVTIYIDSKRIYTIKITKNKILGTDKGYIKHDDLLGKVYGEFIYTSQGVKAYLLKPLLVDYLHTLNRITQIIYPKDSSLMIYLSSINPSSKILEAGVGTGFLTISLANFINEQGRIIGFDIRKEHLEIAQRNLEKTGLIDKVQLILGDIRNPSIIQEESFDAVFYDLPDPWNALETAYRALKPSMPIIVYVPTVNQIEKTVIAMKKTKKFIDIHIYEVLLREYISEEGATRPKTFMIGHTGYIIFARKIL